MLRLLSFAIVLAALVTGTVWLADRPGLVHVEWLDWQIDTSVPVLLAALLAIAVVMIVTLRVGLSLLRIPRRWHAIWRARKMRNGYQALSDGLAAAAAGDGRKAKKLAGKARSLLSDPALTSYLLAQSAKLAGDKDAARDNYKAMLERPETAALGLRGLLDQALERGDDAAAAELAARARLLAPNDPWLADLCFRLAMETERYLDAQSLVADAKRRKAFSAVEASRRLALVLTARAAVARGLGATGEAVSLAKKAFSADPKHTQAALELAAALKEAGKQRRAASVLEQAWKALPAASLAAAYAGLKDGEDALSRLRRLEKLVSGKPEALESHLVLADAAMDAKVWGQSRKHLLAAADLRPGPVIYRQLARLERLEYKNEEAARAWEDRLVETAA
jgi:HemY protein